MSWYWYFLFMILGFMAISFALSFIFFLLFFAVDNKVLAYKSIALWKFLLTDADGIAFSFLLITIFSFWFTGHRYNHEHGPISYEIRTEFSQEKPNRFLHRSNRLILGIKPEQEGEEPQVIFSPLQKARKDALKKATGEGEVPNIPKKVKEPTSPEIYCAAWILLLAFTIALAIALWKDFWTAWGRIKKSHDDEHAKKVAAAKAKGEKPPEPLRWWQLIGINMLTETINNAATRRGLR